MFASRFVIASALVVAVQLQVATSESAYDVTRSSSSDVIRRGGRPTLFQQREQSGGGSTAVPDDRQAPEKSSTSPTSSATPSASPFGKYSQWLGSKRPTVERSSSSTVTQKSGNKNRIHSDMSSTAANLRISNASPPTSASSPDTDVFNTKSSSALMSLSCLWVYSTNTVLRKRLCHCNVGPLQLPTKSSTALQFYFCNNEQDLLATLACHVDNDNRTVSTGNRGRKNCVSGQCNVGPLWIQRSDRHSKQAAYYCSSNTGLQLGQLRQRTTPETSSPTRPTADEHLSYTDIQSSTTNHRDHQQRTIPHPTGIKNNKNSDVNNSEHHIDGINQRSLQSVPADVFKRQPQFGSHARVPGTVPNNSTLLKQTGT